MNPHVSKSNGLKEALALHDISISQCIAFGDEDNDIEMIKDFNGFRMLESSPSLWFTPKIVLEEHHLIKYLNFKSKLKR